MAAEKQQEQAKAKARRLGFRLEQSPASTGKGRDAGPPAPARRRKSSVFGPPAGLRPDMLTDAETVVLPKLTPAAVRLLRPDLLTRDDRAPAGNAPAAAADAIADAAPDAAADSAGTPEDFPESAGDSLTAVEQDMIKNAGEFLATLDVLYKDPADATADAAPGGTTGPATEGTTGPAADRTAGESDAIADEATLPAATMTAATMTAATMTAATMTAATMTAATVPARRRTQVSRLVLLAIVSLQAILSLRLHNTAFEDEALYLYAGGMELEHLLHGTALQGSYAADFSGAPVLYPVLAGVLNRIGGLVLARGLSLAEMLTTTGLLYSLTRRLFSERAALLAAAVFSATEAVIFIGNLATYDATCLFLLALGTWIAVRTAAHPGPLFLLAAPVVSLAVAVKYTGALFVPTIVLMVALAGPPASGRRVLLRPVLLGSAVAVLLYGGLRLGGARYQAALASTTTHRAPGSTPVWTLIHETADWGGLIIALAVIGTIGYARRVQVELDDPVAPAGGRLQRLALGAVLTGTAFLAPAYQAHLHTDVSFLKHIGFGLFFAAPMAGLGLTRVIGDHFRRPQLGIALWCVALVLSMTQSLGIYHSWPDSRTFVRAFSRYLQPHARYLVEVPEVPIYYLGGRPDAQPDQFTSTYNIAYTSPRGQVISGAPGFSAAIAACYFQVVAYNGVTTPAADATIARALTASGRYYLAAQVHVTDAAGPVTYTIWVKGRKPANRPPAANRRPPAGRPPTANRPPAASGPGLSRRGRE